MVIRITDDKSLGEVLRDIRKKSRSMTLETAAQKSGLTIATISRSENGKTPMSSDTLKALSQAYNIKIHYAISIGEEDMKRLLELKTELKE